jgi:hypothetical protein
VQVVGHSRYTADMVAIVQQHVFHADNGYQGYEISIAVQSSNGPFVVERPIYWNASGTQGGSDVIGYAGGLRALARIVLSLLLTEPLIAQYNFSCESRYSTCILYLDMGGILFHTGTALSARCFL